MHTCRVTVCICVHCSAIVWYGVLDLSDGSICMLLSIIEFVRQIIGPMPCGYGANRDGVYFS